MSKLPRKRGKKTIQPSAMYSKTPDNTPLENPTILTMDDIIARINGEKPKEEIYSLANIPLGSKKGVPKTEKEQLQNIIDKRPSIKKVRKFFNDYADRITQEETEIGPEFMNGLK